MKKETVVTQIAPKTNTLLRCDCGVVVSLSVLGAENRVFAQRAQSKESSKLWLDVPRGDTEKQALRQLVSQFRQEGALLLLAADEIDREIGKE